MRHNSWKVRMFYKFGDQELRIMAIVHWILTLSAHRAGTSRISTATWHSDRLVSRTSAHHSPAPLKHQLSLTFRSHYFHFQATWERGGGVWVGLSHVSLSTWVSRPASLSQSLWRSRLTAFALWLCMPRCAAARRWMLLIRNLLAKGIRTFRQINRCRATCRVRGRRDPPDVDHPRRSSLFNNLLGSGLQLASERWQECLPGALDAGRRCADAQQVVGVSFISCSVISCKPVSTQIRRSPEWMNVRACVWACGRAWGAPDVDLHLQANKWASVWMGERAREERATHDDCDPKRIRPESNFPSGVLGKNYSIQTDN